MENLQNKYKRLDIRKYTLPELEIILELGNFDDFTKVLFENAETPQQKQMLREAIQESMM